MPWVILYEEYHPYGTSAWRAAAAGVEVSAKRYRYTGKERDDETGLYLMGARYYAAWLGRWSAADPAGTVDGTNLFAYVRGSPVGLVDPSGTLSKEEIAAWRANNKRLAQKRAVEKIFAEGQAELDQALGVIREVTVGDKSRFPGKGETVSLPKGPPEPGSQRTQPAYPGASFDAGPSPLESEYYFPPPPRPETPDTETVTEAFDDGSTYTTIQQTNADLVNAASIAMTIVPGIVARVAGIRSVPATGLPQSRSAGAAAEGFVNEPPLVFAHGTSAESAASVAKELSAPAATAASKGGTAMPPGSFFAHPVGPPSSPGPGLQLAYEWALRHTREPVVLIGELPGPIARSLIGSQQLRTIPTPGVPDVPQLVFTPESFGAVNDFVIWHPPLKP